MSSLGKYVLLLPDSQKQEFILTKTITLDRITINNIKLPDPNVSRFHAKLEFQNNSLTLINRGSANGVSVIGEKVDHAVIGPGDVIGLGVPMRRWTKQRIFLQTRLDEGYQTFSGTLLEETPWL